MGRGMACFFVGGRGSVVATPTNYKTSALSLEKLHTNSQHSEFSC